ncbi:growth arrest-specific protein 1-like [Choristoneura fumiferana]|uniref:growth arrest-specific protein 1-like n=1 Tax=Choristoneura fumiferana TaxID=7141 RepID=UPI003D158386
MWQLAALLAALAASVAGTPCFEARTRCAYRTGCGAALNNYMMLCNDVLTEPTSVCPKPCEHALIALTSTEEGKELMKCECEDEYCLEAKSRIDVCRPSVLRATANATMSCRLSQLICSADAQCATALSYYHRLCRAMYRGRKCSHKCLNSIEILRKQDKAAALTGCHCDGNEEYDCPRMQNNLARLCFHKKLDNGDKINKTQPPHVVMTGSSSFTSVSKAVLLSAFFYITFYS